MTISNYLKRFKTGDSVHKFCDSKNYNRIANILEDIDGVNGVEIWKPTDAEGRGWKIGLAVDPHGNGATPEPSGDEKDLPDTEDPDAEWNPTDPDSGDSGKGLQIDLSTLEFIEEEGLYQQDWRFHYDRNGLLWRVENRGRNMLFAVTKEMP